MIFDGFKVPMPWVFCAGWTLLLLTCLNKLESCWVLTIESYSEYIWAISSDSPVAGSTDTFCMMPFLSEGTL